MSGERIIRKYPNRRLYDVEASRYVNKEVVRELVAGGENVRVIEDATGEDVTRPLLLQLVAEQELGGKPVLSDEILTQIIRFYGHPMQAVLAEYLEASLAVFFEQQAELYKELQASLIDRPMSTLADVAKQSMDTWLAMQQAMFDEPKRDEDK